MEKGSSSNIHKCMQSIRRYQTAEKEFRDKYKERMARQFKIGACCRVHDGSTC